MPFKNFIEPLIRFLKVVDFISSNHNLKKCGSQTLILNKEITPLVILYAGQMPGKKRDLKDLITRISTGDREAFAELVRRFEKKVYSVAYRMLGNHLDADEVTQETFVRIYERRSELRSVNYISSFILRIATNYSIDLIRRRQKKFIAVDDLDYLPDVQLELAQKIVSPDSFLEDAEILGIIKEGIATLPPKQKLAIVLHDIEGYSKTEIADTLGCPQATVRSNLHIARVKLRKWLEKRM